MVGPSISDEDRPRSLFRLRVGFALFVGFSMGMIVLTEDTTPVALVGAVVGGAGVGGVLAWWLFPNGLGRGKRTK